MPATTEPLLTPEEVSAWTGVPVGTLTQWRYKKIGPKYVKVGRFPKYRHRDIEAWLKERERGGEDAA